MAPQTQQLAPKNYPQVNTRVEPELDQALAQLAEHNGMRKPEIVRLLIRLGIRKLTEDPGRRRDETETLGVLVWLGERMGAELDQLPPRAAARFAKTFGAEVSDWADRALMRAADKEA